MSGDLAAFLAARLDEDEAAAKAATPGEWAALDGGVMSVEDDTQWPVSQTGSRRDREDRVHIARHDPARVLAEVAAKRAILAEHRPVTMTEEHQPCPVAVACARETDWDDPNWAIEWPCDTVRHLAAVYSGHPGYDPAWALSGSPVPDRHHEDEQQQQAHGSGHGERPI